MNDRSSTYYWAPVWIVVLTSEPVAFTRSFPLLPYTLAFNAIDGTYVKRDYEY